MTDTTVADVPAQIERLRSLIDAGQIEDASRRLGELRSSWQGHPDEFPTDAVVSLRELAASIKDARAASVDLVLSEVFGYSSFRPGQREIIEAVINGRDCVGIMPTRSRLARRAKSRSSHTSRGMAFRS